MDNLTLRKKAKSILGKYRSLEVTWKKFDCGVEDGVPVGCGECVICDYFNFLDHASSVASQDVTVQYNQFLDKYIKLVYSA